MSYKKWVEEIENSLGSIEKCLKLIKATKPAKKEPVSVKEWLVENLPVKFDFGGIGFFCEEVWQASEQNRDLLYADLLEMLKKWGAGQIDHNYVQFERIIKEVYRISDMIK